MNSSSVLVVVVGLGARTAVGMTAPATAAAVRAGISGFGQHPFMVDTAGNRMIVAFAPYLSIDITGVERLAEFAGPTAAEAVESLASAPGEKPALPVFVGLPSARPGRSSDLTAVSERIRAEISAHGLQVGKVATSESGHAAGTMAVQAAWSAIRSGVAEFAVAGGADSYLDPETLEWLEANDQLHSAGPENNPYGFIPGEAAGFVLLASASAAARCQLTAALELPMVATTKETKLINTDAVCTGEGLTALFRSLAAPLSPGTQVDDLYCDMNGEPYRADEFGFATIRAGGLFKDPSEFNAPADCWGDVGAASGPLFLVLAEAAARKGYASGPLAVAFTSSESGERSGFITRARMPGGRR